MADPSTQPPPSAPPPPNQPNMPPVPPLPPKSGIADTISKVGGAIASMANTLTPNMGDAVQKVESKAGKETSPITQDQLAEIALERMRWGRRWKLSYLGMMMGIMFITTLTWSILISPDASKRIAENKDTIFWMLIALFSIPMAYMGTNIAEKWMNMKGGK